MLWLKRVELIPPDPAIVELLAKELLGSENIWDNEYNLRLLSELFAPPVSSPDYIRLLLLL